MVIMKVIQSTVLLVALVQHEKSTTDVGEI
jgi:hypothetical protein